jgi:hypothetical protein
MAWQGQAGPEDAGGGGGHVGGVEATVSMDTSGIAPGLTALKSGMEAAGAEIAKLEAKVAASSRWTDRWMVGLGGVGAEANKTGYRLQVFAQGLDDLRYVPEMGLRPILNNIVQISPALGIAAIAAQGFVSAMGGMEGISKTLFGESKTLTEADRMDTLAKNTKRTADETKLLNEHKKEQQRIEAMLGGKSKGETTTATAVQGAFNESNPEAVLAGILAARQERNAPLETDSHLPGAIATRLEQLRTARRVAAGGGTEEEMVRYGAGGPAKEAERLQGELNDLARKLIAARRKDAEREMLAATADPGALLKTVRGRPDLFPAGTEGRLEDAGAANLIAAARRGIQGRKEIADEAKAIENATAERNLDLNAAYKEGQARRVEEDNRRGAERQDPLITPGAASKLQAARDREAQRLAENRQAGENLDAAAPIQRRADDLQERLRHLLNPEKQGQTMAGEAYFGSFHSTTAESPEAKQIREGNKLLAEIKENTSKLQKVQRIAR